jgi:cytochrome d ubiquinol oxidase subunit I
MIGSGVLMILISAWGVVLARRRRLGTSRWFRRAALFGIVLPLLANATGWIFTEVGRQPWIVYGLMTTAKGVSSVPTADVAITLIAFVAIYSALAVVDLMLMTRAARRDLDEDDEAASTSVVPGLVY